MCKTPLQDLCIRQNTMPQMTSYRVLTLGCVTIHLFLHSRAVASFLHELELLEFDQCLRIDWPLVSKFSYFLHVLVVVMRFLTIVAHSVGPRGSSRLLYFYIFLVVLINLSNFPHSLQPINIFCEIF